MTESTLPSDEDKGRNSGGTLDLINVILKNYKEISTRVLQAKDVLIGRKPLSLEADKVQNIIKITEAYNELQRRLVSNPDLAKKVPIIDNFIKRECPEIQTFFKKHTIIHDGIEHKIIPSDYASDLLEKVKEEKEKDLKEKINIILNFAT